MKSLFIAFVALFAGTAPVFAHWGHLGDLGGHSHWIAMGAIAVGAALAAKIAASKGNKVEEDRVEETEEEEGASA